MSKFRVGDKVRCVDAAHASNRLSIGKEYIVRALNDSGGCVRLNNGSSFVFTEDRFELVTEPKTNQWEVYDGLSPLPQKAERHTMPDGVVMWRIPEPVIADCTICFSLSDPNARVYPCIYNSNEDGKHKLKGKTKDGKPFGVWSVDFG